MSHDTLSLSMFWVGLMFVLTPMVVAGVLIAMIWYNRKKRGDGAASPS